LSVEQVGVLMGFPDPLAASPERCRSVLAGSVPPEDLCPSLREYCFVKGVFGPPALPVPAAGWIDGLFQALKPHRFAHSLSVAWTAKVLARRFALDERRAEEAGLLHDCAKCLPLPEMQRIAREHHLTEDEALLASGALLHSVVGAQVAQDMYGMRDPEVLDAIICHNTGLPGMSRLSMCVSLADYIEPNRESFPLLEEVRALAETSLEKALLLSLENTADYVLSRGKYLHPRTRDTIEWLKTVID